MKAVYIYPQSSFATELRSDTLWGLLISAIKIVYSEEIMMNILEKFDSSEPPFIISSVFPFYLDKGEKINLLPKPILDGVKASNLKKEQIDNLKSYKKISFVTKEVFEDFINGKLDETEYYLSNKWKSIESTNNEELILKTSINRLTSGTAEIDGKGQLHYSKEIFFKNGGIYFLVRGESKHIEGALRFLQHFGLGGKNTIGKGSFDYEIEEFEINLPEKADQMITLSLFTPSKKQLELIERNKELCNYNYEVRRGKIGTHFINTGNIKKKGVVVFTEGSTFPRFETENPGEARIIKELNDIKIRYNGFGLCLPMTITRNKNEI